MQNQAVRNLVLSLTSDDAFVEEMRQQHFPKKKILSPFKRMVYPMRNPRFAFDFVDTYARAEQLLPRKSVAPQCGGSTATCVTERKSSTTIQLVARPLPWPTRPTPQH